MCAIAISRRSNASAAVFHAVALGSISAIALRPSITETPQPSAFRTPAGVMGRLWNPELRALIELLHRPLTTVRR